MRWKDNIWTVANAITLLKIPLAILFPWSTAQPKWEIANLVLGGLSDFADGRVARRMGQAGGFGAILDPVCDKIFLLTVMGTYVLQHRLDLGALVVVAFRDVYILGASTVLIVSGQWRHLHVEARFYGKTVTFLQFTLLIGTALGWSAGPALLGLAALSVLACYDYTVEVLRQLRKLPASKVVSSS